MGEMSLQIQWDAQSGAWRFSKRSKASSFSSWRLPVSNAEAPRACLPPPKAVQVANAKAPGPGGRQAITCRAGRRLTEVRRARAHARWAGARGGGQRPRQVAESRHSPQGPATRRRGRGLALTPSLPAPTGLAPPSRALSRAARAPGPPHLLRSCSTGKGSATRSQAR